MNDNTIEQRTEAWHKQRVGKVTGSRAASILGISPFSTPEKTLREMVRGYHGMPKEEEGEFIKNHGRKYERQAMLCFMRKTGLHVQDVGFLDINEWMGASPDGLTEDGGVLELKVPQYARKGAPLKPLSEQPYYVPQLMMEMRAYQRAFAYFAQYRAPFGDPFSPDYIEEDMLIERVEYDPQWFALNETDLWVFYDLYLSELDNPAHLAPLRVRIDTDEAQHIVNRIGEIDDALHNLTEERKAHLEKLVQMADGKDADIWGRKLTRTKDSTSVAYSKAIKELAPNADLAKWTTVKSGYWRLS